MEKIMQNKKALKIICVVLATLLWFYVSYQENPSMTKTVRNVPISIVGEKTLNENGFAVLSLSDDAVDVKATAKRLSLARINNKTLTATIDVSSIKSVGTHILPASVKSSLSSGESYFAKGNDIAVVIEPILSQTKKIEKVISSPSNTSVKLKSSKLSDENVKISAPESVMKKIDGVRTESVIPGDTDGSQTVRLLVYSNDGEVLKGVECDPATVTVNYSLYDVKELPVILKTTDGKRITLPTEYVVEVCGTSGSAFDNLDYIETQKLNLSHFKAGSTVELNLNIPDFVYVEPEERKLTLTLDESYFSKN